MKDKFNNSIGPLAHRSGGNANKGLRAVVAAFMLILGLQTATQYFAFVFLFGDNYPVRFGDNYLDRLNNT